MQLLSFLFFLSSLAIVYNCICIDVFVDLLLMLINLPTVKKKRKKKEEFINLLTSYSYEKLITLPTREIGSSSTLIDNIYTNPM